MTDEGKLLRQLSYELLRLRLEKMRAGYPLDAELAAQERREANKLRMRRYRDKQRGRMES